MRKSLEIEDIAERRRLQGIDDVELLTIIRKLAVGDRVVLTLATTEEGTSGGTLLVELTSVRGSALRGKVVRGPTQAGRPRVSRDHPGVHTRAHPLRPWCHAAAASRFRTVGATPIPLPTSKGKRANAQNPSDKPLNVEEGLRQIGALSERVQEYVQYILNIEALTNMSAETKEKAVFDFHERLQHMERHLARVQEELKLG